MHGAVHGPVQLSLEVADVVPSLLSLLDTDSEHSEQSLKASCLVAISQCILSKRDADTVIGGCSALWVQCSVGAVLCGCSVGAL